MKIGIVGAGFMGTTHAAGWAETEAELIGIVAETTDEAMPLAKQYNARVYPQSSLNAARCRCSGYLHSHASAS